MPTALRYGIFFGLTVAEHLRLDGLRDSTAQEAAFAHFPALRSLAGRRAGLLSGPRGEQIAGRYSMVRTGSFSRGAQWATLIAAIEGSLRLHRHQPGTLPGLAGYLHQRTGGMIGSLLWLIRSAAIQAVIDGTEQVTRTSMDPIPVDIAATPVTLKPATEPVAIKAGDKVEIAVEVVREFGFADEVKLELAADKAPVKLAQPVTIAGNAASGPIVLTADMREATRDAARRLGVACYLEKPAGRALAAAVREAILNRGVTSAGSI